MNFRREKRLKAIARFEIVPLVNVVLLLLFFFVMSSTFTVTASIPIEAATVNAPHFFEQKNFSITLDVGEGGPDNAGKVWVNDKEVAAWDDLSATLRDWHKREPAEMLLIRPDARVSSERLLRVIDIANGLGIEHYVIAAKGGPGA